MPDNDRIPRGVRPVWRDSVRAAMEGRPPLQVGDMLREAVAAGLRAEEVPPIGPLARALHDSAFFGDERLWARVAREYGQRAAGRDLAARLVLQGCAMLERSGGELAGMPETEIARTLGEGALRRWVDAGAFGSEQTLALLVSKHSASPSEAREYQLACLEHASLAVFAHLLEDRPGEAIRAPTGLWNVVGTDRLMDEELD